MCAFTLREIKRFDYKRPDIRNGYANQTLDVNLSDLTIDIKPVTEQMKETFIGGKGFDLWLLWNAVQSSTRWNDPENAICIASGPMGGTSVYPGSGKSIVTCISATTGSVMDSNVGGYFGPYLKFSGFDAMAVQGKSKAPVVVYIDGVDWHVEIFEAEGLPDQSHDRTTALTDHFGKGAQKDISVVTTGPAAHHTLIGCLNFSWYDQKRGRARLKQAGRGGIGTVFADKGIAALVVRWRPVKLETNDPADTALLKRVAKLHSAEILDTDPKQNHMSSVGTAHLVTIMNDYDLLPVRNYRYGSHPDAPLMGEDVFLKLFDKGFDGCWIGCTLSCAHGVKDFVPVSGPRKGDRVLVDGPEYETIAGCGSNCGIFDPHLRSRDELLLRHLRARLDLRRHEHRLCDGMLRDGPHRQDAHGRPRPFLRQQGKRPGARCTRWPEAGFGEIVGQGVRRMKEIFAGSFGADIAVLSDIGMEAKGLEFSEYMSKESLAQQGGYGLALKGPQHDEAWLIFLDMVHNLLPTFDKKAESLHWFPLFRTWFGLCGLCKLPWNDVSPADNKETAEPAKVMKHVEWYAQYYQRSHGQGGDARRPHNDEREGIQLPAHLLRQDGLRPQGARCHPLPGHGAGNR